MDAKKQWFDPADLRHWTCLWVLIAMVGLVWAPAVLSISMAALLVTGLLGLRQKEVRRAAGRRLHTQKAFWALTLLFWVVVPGAIGLEDPDYWASRLRIKLPFLLLPVAFMLLPPLTQRQVRGLHLGLLVVLVVVSLQIGWNYWQHFEAINEQIKKGQPIPTPGNHIRLSLLMAYGVVGGIPLLRSAFRLRFRWETYLIAGLTLFVFLFLHVLSVRSGLVVMYLALGGLLVHDIWTSRRWGLGIAGLVLLAALPLAAYYTVPSFYNKVNYARYELWLRKNDRSDLNYSDGGRLLSWQIGWELFRRQPWTGVGPGNLKQRVIAEYAEDYPQVTRRRMPHNQFLSVAAGSGVIGLAVFLIGFFYPLASKNRWRDPLLVSLYIIVFFSCLVENTLENAEGVGIFAVWVGVLLSTNGRKFGHQ